MDRLGVRIREARNKIKLSQARLSKESGITQAVLSGWELGKSEPSAEQFAMLMRVIDEIKEQVESGKIRLNKKQFVHDMRKTTAKPTIKDGGEYAELAKAMTITPSHAENEEFLSALSQLAASAKQAGEKGDAPTAIALFAGCGGFSLGFRAAGFNVLGHVEINEAARDVYQANFPDSICLGTDITAIQEADVQEWKRRFGHVHVLFGGPPCQGFSLAGKRNPADERNILFKDYLKIASILQPDVLVFENVRLMTSMKDPDGKLFIHRFIKELQEIGYDVKCEELNAQHYGIPQSRERVIVLGVNTRLGIKEFGLPPTTHGDPGQTDLFTYTRKRLVTFRDAVGDLETLEHGESSPSDPLHWAITHPDHVITWLKATPEGKSAHDNEDPGLRPPSGYNTTYKRIYWDEPCSTISTNFNMISGCRNVHPEHTRSFTIREAARCQTFPDEFKFFGPWGEVRKMIGNAVPPLLALQIARHIKHELLSGHAPVPEHVR
ncbi:DNA (cytosine-5-)-methyltransferase [Brevibacillus sp. TJ4]|uniref:DNA (cytosine-5-)-methyltransferase n=1 Tax=Brevibacillus sp. TJ4 TaxID=3234853 RepID=UPI0037D11066